MSRSMQYWNARRARSRLPRVRNTAKLEKATMSNIVCFKAGMTSAFFIDDSNSVMKDTEIMSAATVLEVPMMELYGVRVYRRLNGTKYLSSHYDICDSDAAKRAGIKKKEGKHTIDGLQKDDDVAEVSALMVAYPKTVGVGQHHRVRFESRITGSKIEDKIKFAAEHFGKEIKAKDIFEDGEYVDVVSISKGKGWQGVIKRGGVGRNNHKATQKIRHGGPLGSFGSGKVYYTIPRAGQKGFNYRTEQNKRLLKISNKDEASKFTPSGGYKNYGNINNDVMIVKGSIPGPAKRLVRIKKAIRARNRKGISSPKITEIG